MDFLDLKCKHLPRLCQLTGDYSLADDVFQTAISKVLTTWPNKNDDEVSRILPIVSRRVFLNFVQKERNRRKREIVAAKPIDFLESGDECWSNLMGLLDQAIATLPPKWIEVVRRAYFLGQANKEIACALGLTESGVKSRRARAIERLRAYLSPYANN